MAGAAAPHALGPESHAPGHSSCPPLPGKEKEAGQSPPGLGERRKCPGVNSKSESVPVPSPHRVKSPIAASVSEASPHVPTSALLPVSALPLSALQLKALPFFVAALFASIFLPEYGLSALAPSVYCKYTSSPEAAFGLSWRGRGAEGWERR